MDNAVATAPSTPTLDARTLLARVNHRIALLRAWLSHDHRDEPFWWARWRTPPEAQAERQALRVLANLLHVERATGRGRIHGTRFATLDAQRAWLATMEHRMCGTVAGHAGMGGQSTLAKLRAGELPL